MIVKPTKKNLKESYSLGIPIALALVAQLGISLTDMALITRFGEMEAAGVSLALSIYSIVMVFCLGIITSITPKYAKEYSKETIDKKKLSNLLGSGFWVSVAISILGAVGLCLTPYILSGLGYSRNIIFIASQYNFAAIPGLVVFLIYINIRCFLIGINKAEITTKAMWSALIINFVLSYILIFGIFGVGSFGVLGAGIASSIVRLLILIHVIISLIRDPSFIYLINKEDLLTWPYKSTIFFVILVGTPIGFRLIFSEGYLPILTFYTSSLGEVHLVIHSLALRVESFLAVFAIGFSAASTTLIAWAIEKNDKEDFHNKICSVYFIVVIYVLLVSLGLLIFGRYLGELLFNLTNPESLYLFNKIIVYICLYLFMDCMVTISNGILVGMSDTFYSMISNMLGYWLVTTCLIILFVNILNPDVLSIWKSLCIGSLFILVCNLWRIDAVRRKLFSTNVSTRL